MIQTDIPREQLPSGDVCTAREAADYLGVSPRRVYQLASFPKDKPQLRSVTRFGLRLMMAEDVKFLLQIRETFGRQGGRPRQSGQPARSRKPASQEF